MKICNCVLPTTHGPDVCNNCVHNTDKDCAAPLQEVLQYELDKQAANIKLLVSSAHEGERLRIINIIKQLESKHSSTSDTDIAVVEELENLIRIIEGFHEK